MSPMRSGLTRHKTSHGRSANRRLRAVPRRQPKGWEKHWLDEQVAALRGRTPRQAARGKQRPLLEALLRQFEYEADLLAAEGKSGVDTGWLREELDMGHDRED